MSRYRKYSDNQANHLVRGRQKPFIASAHLLGTQSRCATRSPPPTPAAKPFPTTINNNLHLTTGKEKRISDCGFRISDFEIKKDFPADDADDADSLGE
jgi:hypothetical protein